MTLIHSVIASVTGKKPERVCPKCGTKVVLASAKTMGPVVCPACGADVPAKEQL